MGGYCCCCCEFEDAEYDNALLGPGNDDDEGEFML